MKMETKKIGNITMEVKKLKRLEELIGLIDDAFSPSDSELLMAEIRAITGCTLDDDTIYYEYCSHYYSRCSLEEVVYALINNGEYPDLEEYEIAYWKIFGETDLTDECIYKKFKYSKDKKIEYATLFEDFSLSELLTWIEKQVPLWNREDRKDSSGIEGLDHYSFDLEENEEYGIEKYIVVTVHHDQMVEVGFKNIDKNIRNGLAEYMKSLGKTVYYI